MSALRKLESKTSWGDVPLPFVLGAVGVLVAGFVPQIVTGPALPSTLPPLSLDPRASAATHARAQRTTPPAYVRDAFARLGAASERRDSGATAVAARDFAEALVQAAGDDDRARAAIRESLTDGFMHEARARSSGGFVAVAARHRVVRLDGPPPSERELAVARAWFAFRFEALGARASLRGESISLEQTLQKITHDDRRALFAWVLDAECNALLGLPADASLTRAQVQRCSSVRLDFVSLAPAVEPSYPRAEAQATIDALEGRALLAIAARVTDSEPRNALRAAAREAMERAHGRFQSLAASTHERRIVRYMLGAERGEQL